MADAISNDSASFHHLHGEGNSKDADGNHNTKQQLNIPVSLECVKRRISMTGNNFQLFINIRYVLIFFKLFFYDFTFV